MPNAPMSPQSLDHVGRDLPLAVDPVAVHPLGEEALEPLHERPGALHVRRVHRGEGMNQVEAERALEQLAHEAGRLPLLLARRLGDLPGLLLGGERRRGGWRAVLRTSVMALGLGEVWRTSGALSPRSPCKTRSDDVALPALEVVSVAQVDADGRRDGTGMDQGKPAEARSCSSRSCAASPDRRLVQPELGADGGQRLLPGGEVARAFEAGRPRSAPRARSAGRSWAGRRGSRSSRRRRRRESLRGSGCWPGPAPGLRGRPRGPPRRRVRAPPGTARPCSRRSSPGCRG